MSAKSSPSDDEEQEVTGHGRPNDYWRRVREESGSDTYGGAFRGTPPLPRKKQEPPLPIGSEELCWCGLPHGHDWPGKDAGLKHPRKETMSAMTEERSKIDRLILKAYDEDIAAVIAMAVNQYHCRFKLNKSSITVWGLNKSASPMTFGTNSGGHDIKKARSWLTKNVIGLDTDKGKITNPMVKDPEVVVEDLERRAEKQVRQDIKDEELQRLAEALNGPEHEVPTPKDMPQTKQATQSEASGEEWVPFKAPRGQDWTGKFETNGKMIRCTRCDYTADNARGVFGHDSTVHDKEETRARLWDNEEANAKKVDTHRYNTLRAKVTEAMDLIADLVDYSGDSTKIATLEAQNKALRSRVTELEEQCSDASEWKAKAEDAEARLALLREALGA